MSGALDKNGFKNRFSKLGFKGDREILLSELEKLVIEFSVNNNNVAFQTYVNNAITALINGAPAALDTLNELAAALGNDANFSTTVLNSLTSKESSANKDTDSTLAANSDTRYASQKAIKTYVDKMKVSVSVKEYGAVGDGSTDDTAAIIAWLAAISGKSGVIPAGTYMCNNLGTIPANTKIFGYGATLKKNANGDLASLAQGVEITGLSIHGNGGASQGNYTGKGFVITSGNDQKLYNTNIYYCKDRCLAISKDVGIRFNWIGGTVFRSDAITDIPILLGSGGASLESNGDRIFDNLFASDNWLIDVQYSQTTIISNCDFINMNFNANAVKTLVIGNRIATLGNDLVIDGSECLIDGNIIAGGITINSGAQYNRIGVNTLTTGSVITNSSGNSTNQFVQFSSSATYGSAGQYLISNGAGNLPSWQTPSVSQLSDTKTGSGNIVLATGPTLSNPIVGTQSAGDNSTKAASTAYVDQKPGNITIGAAATSLSNATGYLFGSIGQGFQLTFSRGGVPIPKTGTITQIILATYSATGGTTGQTLTWAKNGVTQATLSTSYDTTSGATRILNITGLNLSVTAGDYIELYLNTAGASTTGTTVQGEIIFK